MKEKSVIDQINDDEISLSEITLDYDLDHLEYPDFNETYDNELKMKQAIINSLLRKLKKLELMSFIAWFLIIPCLAGLLVNDSFKGSDANKTIVAVKK
jgi:hypothetical protein